MDAASRFLQGRPLCSFSEIAEMYNNLGLGYSASNLSVDNFELLHIRIGIGKHKVLLVIRRLGNELKLMCKHLA